MKWITISPAVSIKATRDGYLVRNLLSSYQGAFIIPNDVLEKLREQEWQLDSEESRKK